MKIQKHTQEEILTDWLDRYARLINHVVILYRDDQVHGEDLFQEIALALWRSIPNFEERSKESTWIYRVALNTAISGVRKRFVRTESTDSVDEITDSKSNISIEQSSELDWVYKRLKTMNPIDRSLVLLYLDGNSYREISEIIGTSESNVGVKINRIKERLKVFLDTEET